VRYYNEFPTSLPAESLKYYTDFPIQITIKPAVDFVNLEQTVDDVKTCQHNIFPLSYGSDDSGINHINSHVFIMGDASSNILLSG
jgi:hypothetical protein